MQIQIKFGLLVLGLWLAATPARAGALGIENYSDNYYYIIAHGKDLSGITYKNRSSFMHLAPKGTKDAKGKRLDEDAFHMDELNFFEIGVTTSLKDTVGKNWRVINIKQMNGIPNYPLGSNWNFEVDGDPPTINTMKKWKPEAYKIAPKAKDPRRD